MLRGMLWLMQEQEERCEDWKIGICCVSRSVGSGWEHEQFTCSNRREGRIRGSR